MAKKKQETSVLYEKSSGNVFSDLGLPNPELEDMRVQLSLKIFQIIKAESLTQAKVALLFRIGQPEVSKLKHGLYHLFSIERLVCFLNLLGYKVDIKLDFHKI